MIDGDGIINWSNSDIVDIYNDELSVEAFILDNLATVYAQTTTSNANVKTGIATAIINCLTKDISIGSDVYFSYTPSVRLEGNPYRLASEIIALSDINQITAVTSTFTDLQSAIDNGCEQLSRYVQQGGLVELPMGVAPSDYVRREITTVYGGIGLDR